MDHHPGTIASGSSDSHGGPARVAICFQADTTVGARLRRRAVGSARSPWRAFQDMQVLTQGRPSREMRRCTFWAYLPSDPGGAFLGFVSGCSHRQATAWKHQPCICRHWLAGVEWSKPNIDIRWIVLVRSPIHPRWLNWKHSAFRLSTNSISAWSCGGAPLRAMISRPTNRAFRLCPDWRRQSSRWTCPPWGSTSSFRFPERRLTTTSLRRLWRSTISRGSKPRPSE